MEPGEEPGASPCLDRLVAMADPAHEFLRAAWFAAGAGTAPLKTLVARDSDGAPIAAIPLVSRAKGPFRLNEVPGSYWPFRSVPVARDASDEALTACLASPAARAALGAVWRIGPIYADDPTGRRLVALAPRAGWTLLRRRLGTAFVVDLARLAAEGPWPGTKTLRKNRWCERRLAAMGELNFRTVCGADWNPGVLDTLAAVESQSWVGAGPGSGDTKFLCRESRRVWERAIADPALATKLSCSLLYVGGAPAAFTFRVAAGASLHYIANSYSERFAAFSAGRILLYRDFQAAAAAGVERIVWGAGDPGYKSEMGARPGSQIFDYLLVRGRLRAALARLWWERRS